VLTFTCGAVVGGLRAAESFAKAFGEVEMAERYGHAAAQVRQGMEKHLWDPQRRRFLRMLRRASTGTYEPDATIDASLYGCWRFGAFAPDEPQSIETMRAVRDRLWLSTPTGGLARYEGDRYQAVTEDFEKVPGNPWPVCTLWLAQHAIAKARNIADLREAIPFLSWVASHALPSGVLPEQLHPLTGAPLSVSPLTWSHAELVATVFAWLEKRQSLDICPTCKTPRFFVRPLAGNTESRTRVQVTATK
jgi:GH15 family glucan-1,4-alpha-glucosidase